MDASLCQLHATAAQKHWWFLGRRRILDAVLETVLPAGQDKLVIEVGCGTGENIERLRHRYRALGVDPSMSAIEYARRRFPQGCFLCGYPPQDVPQLPQADAVLLLDVLEHVQDDRQLLRGLVDATKPGCWFVVTVPADMRLWSSHDVTHGHFRRYELGELRELLAGAPVDIRLTSFFNSRLYWLVRAVRWWSRRAGRSLGPGGTDLWVPPSWLNRLLAEIFASEARHLVDCLTQARPRTRWRRGVSLLLVAVRVAEVAR